MNAIVKKLDGKLRGFAVPALTGALCILLLVLTVLNITAVSALDTMVRYEESLFELNHLQKDALVKLSQEEESSRALLERYKGFLTSGENQTEIFSRIQSLSQDYSVSVSQVNFSAVQVENALRKLPLEMTVNGDYPRVMALLEEFSRGTRLTTLDALSLSENTGENTIRAHVKASVFFE